MPSNTTLLPKYYIHTAMEIYPSVNLCPNTIAGRHPDLSAELHCGAVGTVTVGDLLVFGLQSDVLGGSQVDGHTQLLAVAET